jgi:hypothetical protein
VPVVWVGQGRPACLPVTDALFVAPDPKDTQGGIVDEVDDHIGHRVDALLALRLAGLVQARATTASAAG